MANTSLTAQKPKFSVAISTPGYQKLISNTLSDPKRASRFVASVSSAVAVNPALQECEAGSILSSALLGESLNLSPSPQLGQYYLVPFKSKAKYDKQGNLLEPETHKAQFILGYKGYLQLAIRSGYYSDIDAKAIHDGEYKGRDKSTGKPLFEFIEDEDEADSLPVVGYMAYFEYMNGFRKTLYWSREKMMSHADKYSAAFSADAYLKIQDGKISDKDMWKYSSFWYKDFDSMALKTMLRQLISKWGVMSIEMQIAVENDDKVVTTSGDGLFTPDAESYTTPAAVPDSAAGTVPPEALQPETSNAVEQASLDDF